MDAKCSADERIFIKDVNAGAKLISTGCDRATADGVSFEDEELCCKPADEDCKFDLSVSGGYEENYKYHINCTGKSQCDKVRVVAMETPSTCSSAHWDTSNYLYMYYHCIPGKLSYIMITVTDPEV